MSTWVGKTGPGPLRSLEMNPMAILSLEPNGYFNSTAKFEVCRLDCGSTEISKYRCVIYQIPQQKGLLLKGLEWRVGPFQEFQGHKQECLLPCPCASRNVHEVCLLRVGKGAGSRAASGCRTRTKVYMPNIQYLSRSYSSWIPWHKVLGEEPGQTGLQLSPQGYGAILRFIAGTMVGESAAQNESSQNGCPYTRISQLPICISELPQRHFCLQMDVKLLLFREDLMGDVLFSQLADIPQSVVDTACFRCIIYQHLFLLYQFILLLV